MFFLYQIILTLILIFSPLIIIFRILENKEDQIRFKEKFTIPTKNKLEGKLIWFHGASVGEIQSIVPLINYYEKNKFIKQILITSSTLSSSKIIRKYKFNKTFHQFYPIDHTYFTKKFLKYWKPNIAIFIESEIWPSMYKEINNRNIPLILLNARITKKTFNRWNKIKFFSKNIFDKVMIAYPQNQETKNYLQKLNFPKIKFIGNLKFSENNEDKNKNKFLNLKKKFKNKKIWVASSTHKGEEIFCIKTHLALKKKVKNLITVIIPRHVHRVNSIIKEIENLNFDLNITIHSSNKENLNSTDVYIVDTFGENKFFHMLGQSVFLGGSIIKRGGQNPLEAARYNANIFHGPNIDNFTDVYKFLKKYNISKKINNSKQLVSSLVFKKNKNQGNKIRNIGKKILNKTVKELDSIIKNESKKT